MGMIFLMEIEIVLVGRFIMLDLVLIQSMKLEKSD